MCKVLIGWYTCHILYTLLIICSHVLGKKVTSKICLNHTISVPVISIRSMVYCWTVQLVCVWTIKVRCCRSSRSNRNTSIKHITQVSNINTVLKTFWNISRRMNNTLIWTVYNPSIFPKYNLCIFVMCSRDKCRYHVTYF